MAVRYLLKSLVLSRLNPHAVSVHFMFNRFFQLEHLTDFIDISHLYISSANKILMFCIKIYRYEGVHRDRMRPVRLSIKYVMPFIPKKLIEYKILK